VTSGSRRVQTTAQKVDALFGADYARSHPEVLVVVVQSAASDWAAQRLGVAIERVAEALLVEVGGDAAAHLAGA
jgi:prolyl-tRNA editing enzyme YbaK/EbsC (Cys-tRNA(Pro) deacylase)